MDYGEDDAQAVENIARQLHNPAQKEEIRRLLQSFLDHADPEEEIAADITLCMEQIGELPPALTPDQTQQEEIAGYLEEAGVCGFGGIDCRCIAEYQAMAAEAAARILPTSLSVSFWTRNRNRLHWTRPRNLSTIFAWPSMAAQPISAIWKRWALPTPPLRTRKSPSRSMPIWSITALSVIWTGSFGAQAV